MQGPLVLVSTHTKPKHPNSPDALAPRQDYVEIARRSGGTIVGYDLFDAPWYRWVRQIEERLKLDVAESLFAVTKAAQYSVVLSTSEKIALPLAVLFSAVRRQTAHVVIAHKLSSGRKTFVWRMGQLQHTFAQIICVCQAQADYAVQQLGVPRSNVNFVYDKVDQRFFQPRNGDTEGYILAVGQEQRDYQTLLRAIAGTGIKLVVVASSPWSTDQTYVDEMEDVTVISHISYRELRSLYARARFVVVPLRNVDYAAGVNTLLEAMSMAKAVIVSRTRGIIDYVVQNETGIYVSPGAPDELRAAILSLWETPRECNRLGINARQMVEEHMNLDIYVDQVTRILHKAIVLQ